MTAYTPPDRTSSHSVISLCSCLRLGTFAVNTCYYCTAESSKASGMNVLPLTAGYKWLKGWGLQMCACVSVSVLLMLVCVRHAFRSLKWTWWGRTLRSCLVELKSWPLHDNHVTVYLFRLVLNSLILLHSLSLWFSQRGGRWIGGGLGGNYQGESEVERGGFEEQFAECSHNGSSPAQHFQPVPCQDSQCRGSFVQHNPPSLQHRTEWCPSSITPQPHVWIRLWPAPESRIIWWDWKKQAGLI